MHHINTLTKINIKIDKFELPTFHWLQKLHKRPYRSVLYQIQGTALLPFFLSILHFWQIENSSEVIEKLRLRNFQGSQVSSFDFSSLYTSLSHDRIKAKLLSVAYLCTSLKAGFFLVSRNMTRIDVGLARSYEKLLLSTWKTYMCNLVTLYINK